MKHAKESTAGSRAKNGLLVLALLLLLSAAVFLMAYFLAGRGGSGLKYEKNATAGAVTIGSTSLEEMQAMVDRGMITMSINASPAMSLSDPAEGVNWLIENPAEQSSKLLRVEVIRNDTQEKIYETGALQPGTYVTGTLPEMELEVGAYDCTAYFYSYDIETEEFLGKAGSQITLYVQP